MSDEVYVKGTHHKKYMSPYQIRKAQKKALQSYQQIDTIKNIATKEATKASDEAEQKLEKFITSGSDHNDK